MAHRSPLSGLAGALAGMAAVVGDAAGPGHRDEGSAEAARRDRRQPHRRRLQVQRGDTLAKIDERAYLPPGTVEEANPQIANKRLIYVGEEVNVPCPNIADAGPGAPKSEGCVGVLTQELGADNTT